MYLGIDIGSTTIKTVLCDRDGDILYSDYRRHNTDITATAAAGTAPEEAHGTSCPTGADGADMEQERLTTRRFETSDRGRTIVVPYFAEGYSEFIPSVLKVMGYDAISLPPGTQDDVEAGLRCANNDICYPATIVVGSIINFLKSGNCRGLKELIGQAAGEFAAAIRTELHPRIIGIVGEIYVKYNSFNNKDVVRWLNRHGIETAVPSVYNFFISAFANRHINKREHIKKLQTRSGPPMPCTCGCAAAPGHLTVPARHARDTVRSPMSLRMLPKRPG